MKPTKVRNRQTYRAMNQVINKQISSPISKDLRKKYSRRSARIIIDDTVKVIRGEYKGLTGKVSKVSTDSNSIAIEGNKKEKLKGDKIDVYIHTTNVIITALNTNDKWRLKILEKKSKSKIKSMKEEDKKKVESKNKKVESKNKKVESKNKKVESKNKKEVKSEVKTKNKKEDK